MWLQVRKRPHLQEFLERCAELFEVVIFTASQKIYAEQLLNVIDAKRSAGPLFPPTTPLLAAAKRCGPANALGMLELSHPHSHC